MSTLNATGDYWAPPPPAQWDGWTKSKANSSRPPRIVAGLLSFVIVSFIAAICVKRWYSSRVAQREHRKEQQLRKAAQKHELAQQGITKCSPRFSGTPMYEAAEERARQQAKHDTGPWRRVRTYDVKKILAFDVASDDTGPPVPPSRVSATQHRSLPKELEFMAEEKHRSNVDSDII